MPNLFCLARTGTTRLGPSASPTCLSRARMPTTSGATIPSPRTALTGTPKARKSSSTTCWPIRPLVWSGNNRPVSSRRKPIRLATTGASVQGYRASTTAHCCFCSTCCQRCARPRKAAAGLASSSMVRRYSPATPAVARATFASGSSRTIGWRLSSRCRTSFSTTPASPPTSGCSPIARSSGAKARCT